MGCKIYVSKKGFLVYRLYWNQRRTWEGTSLADTPENRALVKADAIRISREMKAGRFDYLKWFPARDNAAARRASGQDPTIREYYDSWILQKKPPLVRKSLERDYRQVFNRYLAGVWRDDIQRAGAAPAARFQRTAFNRRPSC